MEPHLLNKATVFLLLTLASLRLSEAATLDNTTDKVALLELKSHLTEYPDGAFSSWKESVDFCLWKGVECANGHHRVTGIHLKRMNLYGHVSPSIGNLSFLQELDLSQNFLNGGIPPELGRLARLKNMNLSFNLLAGLIPTNLSRCSDLIAISLDHNLLTQQIPWELGRLSRLENLHLNSNRLTGVFPFSLGNLSSLREISVAYNEMAGEIPETIGKLRSLTSLDLSINHFSGAFPPAIYNLSSLALLALTKNSFQGNLRDDIGLVFPKIQKLWFSENNFTGQFPISLLNASSLVELDLSLNRFTGKIPTTLGNLRSLTFLNFFANFFGSYVDDDLLFLESLANCSSLQVLDMSTNQLGGKLTGSLANLSSQLFWFNIESNRISGRIPEETASLVGLTILDMGSNLLTGNIPPSIGNLPQLKGLYLGENYLVGEIPSSIGNLTQLLDLYLFNNSLEGSLPSTFSNLKLLEDARLYHNKLNGSIPPHFIGLPSLTIVLNLSFNSFTGPLPAEVGKLTSLTALDVSYNSLSGDIPSDLGFCLSLNTLNMQHNLFRGSVPNLNQLKGLQYLDLSKNNLFSPVPEYFVNFPSLMNLNLSYNNFQGKVPQEGVFKNGSAIQVYGNKNLCGGISQLNLKPCPAEKTRRSRRQVKLKLLLPPVLVSSCLLLLLSMFAPCKKSLMRVKQDSKPSFGRLYPKVSFLELYNSTHGFSLDNLIGAGSYGKVYKGILGEGESPIAIKVLNLHQQGASKSFVSECQALGNIRHKNLVRILTVCSGADRKGNDFKALLYPYMPNGSLDKWLHPEDGPSQGRNLNLLQRINIAIDIASALQYLHHQCQHPIIHCDLKPSNVLLDSDLTAHVSDFGLMRLLTEFRGEGNSDQLSSLGIKGTLGYIAPEYGIGSAASTLGDVYSYGIVLLELFTGRSPVDETFKDNFNLHNFVKLAFLDEVLEIIDPSAFLDQVVKDVSKGAFWRSMNKEMVVDCAVSVLQIGIECSAENPHDRIDMKQVVHKLTSAKKRILNLVMQDQYFKRNPRNRTRESDWRYGSRNHGVIRPGNQERNTTHLLHARPIFYRVLQKPLHT